ncbi:hypothetical protein B0J14DRAFT_602246 [Halenospora varia]|nr:hypothetical protein B0J14DRAFT_602246 [Halenospora varia]
MIRAVVRFCAIYDCLCCHNTDRYPLDGTSCISSFCCGSSACVVDLRQCCKNGQVCLPGETCMIDSVGVFCKNTAGGTVSAKSSTAVKTTISTTQTATAKTTAVVTNTAKTTATASVTGPATTATSVVSVPASTVTAANQPVATVIKGGGANREGVSLSVVLAGVAAMALF